MRWLAVFAFLGAFSAPSFAAPFGHPSLRGLHSRNFRTAGHYYGGGYRYHGRRHFGIRRWSYRNYPGRYYGAYGGGCGVGGVGFGGYGRARFGRPNGWRYGTGYGYWRGSRAYGGYAYGYGSRYYNGYGFHRPYVGYFVRPFAALAPIYLRYGASLTLEDDVLERDAAAPAKDADGDGIPHERTERVGNRFLTRLGS